MMKFSFKWTFRTHFIISLVITLISYTVDSVMSNGYGSAMLMYLTKGHSLFVDQQAASIGIIGGADGPTSIFITGEPIEFKIFSNLMLFIILLLLYKPSKYLVEKSIGVK